jgi:hypothetical protein
VEAKIAEIGPMGEEMGPTMRPRTCSPLTSSSHGPLFPEKMMWQNDWARLTSGRSLKMKNMQKQENLLRSAKTK